jgi:hypothetical protein
LKNAFTFDTKTIYWLAGPFGVQLAAGTAQIDVAFRGVVADAMAGADEGVE